MAGKENVITVRISSCQVQIVPIYMYMYAIYNVMYMYACIHVDDYAMCVGHLFICALFHALPIIMLLCKIIEEQGPRQRHALNYGFTR